MQCSCIHSTPRHPQHSRRLCYIQACSFFSLFYNTDEPSDILLSPALPEFSHHIAYLPADSSYNNGTSLFLLSTFHSPRSDNGISVFLPSVCSHQSAISSSNEFQCTFPIRNSAAFLALPIQREIIRFNCSKIRMRSRRIFPVQEVPLLIYQTNTFCTLLHLQYPIHIHHTSWLSQLHFRTNI